MQLLISYNAIFMHRMESQIHIQAMYNIQIHIHIIHNMHINNNNQYTKIHRCATNDSTAQPTRLSAPSGLTSTRPTSDNPHSIKPTQFISEPRQFGTPGNYHTYKTQYTG